MLQSGVTVDSIRTYACGTPYAGRWESSEAADMTSSSRMRENSLQIFTKNVDNVYKMLYYNDVNSYHYFNRVYAYTIKKAKIK